MLYLKKREKDTYINKLHKPCYHIYIIQADQFCFCVMQHANTCIDLQIYLNKVTLCCFVI